MTPKELHAASQRVLGIVRRESSGTLEVIKNKGSK